MNDAAAYAEFLDLVFFLWGLGITWIVVAMYFDKYTLWRAMKPRFWERPTISDVEAEDWDSTYPSVHEGDERE